MRWEADAIVIVNQAPKKLKVLMPMSSITAAPIGYRMTKFAHLYDQKFSRFAIGVLFASAATNIKVNKGTSKLTNNIPPYPSTERIGSLDMLTVMNEAANQQ